MFDRIRIVILDDELNPVAQIVDSIRKELPSDIFGKMFDGSSLKSMLEELKDWHVTDIYGALRFLMEIAVISGQKNFKWSIAANKYPNTFKFLKMFLENLPMKINIFHSADELLKIDRCEVSGYLAENNPDIVICDWKLREYRNLPYGLMGSRILAFCGLLKKSVTGFYSAFKPDMLQDQDNAVIFYILENKGKIKVVEKTQLYPGVYNLYLNFLEDNLLRDVPYHVIQNLCSLIDGLDKQKKDVIEWAEAQTLEINNRKFSLYTLSPFMIWARANNKSREYSNYKGDIRKILDTLTRNTGVGMIKKLYEEPIIKQLFHPGTHTNPKFHWNNVNSILANILGSTTNGLNAVTIVENRAENSLPEIRSDPLWNLRLAVVKKLKEFYNYEGRITSIPEHSRYVFRLHWRNKGDNEYTNAKKFFKQIFGIEVQGLPTNSDIYNYFYNPIFSEGLSALKNEINESIKGNGIANVKVKEISADAKVLLLVYQNNPVLTGIEKAYSILKDSCETLRLFCEVVALGEFNGKIKTWNTAGYWEEGKYTEYIEQGKALWILGFSVER